MTDMSDGNWGTLLQHVKLEDICKLNFAKHAALRISELTNASRNAEEEIGVGWALKTRAGNVRFSEKQKNFVASKFFEGERTGRKFTAEAVAKQMKTACDANGAKLFSHKEFMAAAQITGLWRRLSSKKGDFQAAELATVTSSITSDI